MERDEIAQILKELRARGLSNGGSLGYHAGWCDEVADVLEELTEENERLHANCTDHIRDLHTLQVFTACKMREFAFQIIDELLNMMWDENASCCIVKNCQKSSDTIPCGSEICRVENRALWREKFDQITQEFLGGEQK